MVRISIPVALLLLLLFSGCGGASSEGERANELYRQAEMKAEEGEHSQAVELLSQAIELQPRAFIYLKRAEYRLTLADDEAARADVAAAEELGAPADDCQWLLSEADKPLASRFQEQAAPPSYNK